jgi:hypothetical protein
LDIARSEQVETDLDRLIEKRHGQRVLSEGERPSEELWTASERIYEGKRQRRRAWEWVRYFEEQAARAERNGALVAAANRRKAHALIAELEDGDHEERNGHHE